MVVGAEVGKDDIMACKAKIVLFSPVYRKTEVSECCEFPISLILLLGM